MKLCAHNSPFFSLATYRRHTDKERMHLRSYVQLVCKFNRIATRPHGQVWKIYAILISAISSTFTGMEPISWWFPPCTWLKSIQIERFLDRFYLICLDFNRIYIRNDGNRLKSQGLVAESMSQSTLISIDVIKIRPEWIWIYGIRWK